MKMRRPPKWNSSGMATFRLYCSRFQGLHSMISEDNCHFGITLRYDPEMVGEYWTVGESYDQQKMCHTHELKPSVSKLPDPTPKIVEHHPDEEKIDSDNDTYGDEDMKFYDKDPLGFNDSIN